jgi:hypothetical protein
MHMYTLTALSLQIMKWACVDSPSTQEMEICYSLTSDLFQVSVLSSKILLSWFCANYSLVFVLKNHICMYPKIYIVQLSLWVKNWTKILPTLYLVLVNILVIKYCSVHNLTSLNRIMDTFIHLYNNVVPFVEKCQLIGFLTLVLDIAFWHIFLSILLRFICFCTSTLFTFFSVIDTSPCHPNLQMYHKLYIWIYMYIYT